jgi:hypothetical protein
MGGHAAILHQGNPDTQCLGPSFDSLGYFRVRILPGQPQNLPTREILPGMILFGAMMDPFDIHIQTTYIPDSVSTILKSKICRCGANFSRPALRGRSSYWHTTKTRPQRGTKHRRLQPAVRYRCNYMDQKLRQTKPLRSSCQPSQLSFPLRHYRGAGYLRWNASGWCRISS